MDGQKIPNYGSIVTFNEGSVILQEGEVNLDMYKILKGNAELYTGYGTDKEVLLGIIGPQACFGEFGLLMQAPAIYTVVAFSNVYAMRIAVNDLDKFAIDNYKNIIDIMKNMARTMTVMQRQIDLLTEEIEYGKTPDKEVIAEENKKTLRGYAVYNPNQNYRLTGKYHFINTWR
jgi:CRP-like cAMP-binding protein